VSLASYKDALKAQVQPSFPSGYLRTLQATQRWLVPPPSKELKCFGSAFESKICSFSTSSRLCLRFEQGKRERGDEKVWRVCGGGGGGEGDEDCTRLGFGPTQNRKQGSTSRSGKKSSGG
jgi:hypothetical protein